VKSSSSGRGAYRSFRTCVLLLSFACCQATWAQIKNPLANTQSTVPPASTQLDPHGRSTPRGTVLGFLAAGYSHDYETASLYLNTRLRGKDAAVLAEHLFFVLDRRLPAKLNNVSNDPQGSLSDPLDARRELVGTVASDHGKVDFYVERVDQDNGIQIWLFSRQTLATVPDLYEEINAVAVEGVLPEFLLRRYFGIQLFAWIYCLVLIPLFYLFLGLVSRLLSAATGYAFRRFRKRPEISNPKLLPHAVRLLIMGVVLNWTLSKFSFSLLTRQVGSITVTIIMVVGLVWLLILVNGRVEAHIRKRMGGRGQIGSTAILRPARRVMDLFAAVAGFMFALHSFGVNPSAALAGLGLGGIAVALAAQKTLENVIGGASIILDGAVRVGDFLKMGDVIGTVEEIGLRSTRVRTLDRTLVTIPNGQMATITLENYSSRDSFWFRHMIGLRFETSSPGLNMVLTRVRKLLEEDRRIVPSSTRVRFLRFGDSSLELEIFAYVYAGDWNHFLQIQEELLLQIKDLIGAAGVQIGLPAHAVYLKHETENELMTLQQKVELPDQENTRDMNQRSGYPPQIPRP
jgi:MscS family membrane protein